jgi:predicted nucleic acid-binding protein
LNQIERAVQAGESVFLSAISLVELIYLSEKGRLPAGALTKLEEALRAPDSSMVVVPLDSAVAKAVARISRSAVPDMPDRIIAATAAHLGVPLVTRDRQIQAAGINTIW